MSTPAVERIDERLSSPAASADGSVTPADTFAPGDPCQDVSRNRLEPAPDEVAVEIREIVARNRFQVKRESERGIGGKRVDGPQLTDCQILRLPSGIVQLNFPIYVVAPTDATVMADPAIVRRQEIKPGNRAIENLTVDVYTNTIPGFLRVYQRRDGVRQGGRITVQSLKSDWSKRGYGENIQGIMTIHHYRSQDEREGCFGGLGIAVVDGKLTTEGTSVQMRYGVAGIGCVFQSEQLSMTPDIVGGLRDGRFDGFVVADSPAQA